MKPFPMTPSDARPMVLTHGGVDRPPFMGMGRRFLRGVTAIVIAAIVNTSLAPLVSAAQLKRSQAATLKASTTDEQSYANALRSIYDQASRTVNPNARMPAPDLGNRPEQRVAMSRLRARVAERLLQSQATNAILTTFNEVNMAPVMELRKKYDCNMPWILLFDPTSACNLHCKGCWAAEYGNRLNLSFEDMDRIVTEGEALGIHWYMCTGGEPTCRKEDLFKLAAKHQNSVFHLFTNGTLIDQAFCDRVKEVGNMAFFISIEGIGDATDDRRGEGVYDRVMHAMDLMKENGLLFGTSICYTSANYKAVTSDEFMDMLISHGVRFNWYFHYMPIGDGANVDLMLNAEQREYMIHRVREIRGYTGGKPIFCIDFQNDGEYIDGCIAGGRQYAHINPAGDVEPCVFIHYSNANIHDKSLLECLQQPLFKEYHKGQPFNHNHLRPCPMLENPELLGEMVKRSGAHSTDMQQPESTDDVFRRCRPYADQWTPSADRIWADEHPDCASCASCSACASK